MRKGQRFTPARLRAWQLSGRGSGTASDYQPWHQVTRGDPGSRGRSHLVNWKLGRLHHLLSDHELLIMGFATMVPGLSDIREQFPLCLETHQPELVTYRSDACRKPVPGTLELAQLLGVRHPRLRVKDDAAWWVMTTDLLLTIGSGRAAKLLAVSVKFDDALASPRTMALLALEQAYWSCQGVEWLLITPSTYAVEVGRSVVNVLPWGLATQGLTASAQYHCTQLKPQIHGATVRQVLQVVSKAMGCSHSDAAFVLWGAVWSGLAPIDLDVRMCPEAVLHVLPHPNFYQQNPIIARRTTWQP